MVRDYEIVYIFHPSLEDEQVTEKLDRFHALVADASVGEITAVDHWGKRQFAYPIGDQTTGHYTVVHFKTDGTRLPEFERILKLDEQVLRYLIVVNEGELATTPVAPTPKREDEDGEDDSEG